MSLVMTILGNKIEDGLNPPEELMPLEILTHELMYAEMGQSDLKLEDVEKNQNRIMTEARTLAKLSEITGPTFAMSAFFTQLLNCQNKYL